MGHCLGTWMGFCPGIWMGLCPGIWMGFCLGLWMGFCPGIWMKFCPGTWMGVFPGTDLDMGFYPGTWMGASGWSFAIMGFCPVAITFAHAWMEHLPHAGANTHPGKTTSKCPSMHVPRQNSIHVPRQKPHWVSMCLPSMCPGKTPSMCPDKGQEPIHKHRGHTHAIPTSHPLSGIIPPPFTFALAFAWADTGANAQGHFSRFLTGIPFHIHVPAIHVPGQNPTHVPGQNPIQDRAHSHSSIVTGIVGWPDRSISAKYVCLLVATSKLYTLKTSGHMHLRLN